MVALIDDDMIPVAWPEPVDEPARPQARDRREQVIELAGLVVAGEQRAERRVAKHVTEGVARLHECCRAGLMMGIEAS